MVNTQPLSPNGPHDKDFDKVADYRHRINLHKSVLSAIGDQPLLVHTIDTFVTACNINENRYNVTTEDSAFNYIFLRPLFD